MPLMDSSVPEVRTLMTGLMFGESPRWRDGRFWVSDWVAHEIIAVDLEGKSEVVVREPGPQGRPIEPLTGQFVMDFETAQLQSKVHSLGTRTAEEWFDLAMALDGKQETMAEAVDAYGQAIKGAPEWIEPHINLGVGSGTHAEQTGEILKRVEPILLEQQPDLVLMFFEHLQPVLGIAGRENAEAVFECHGEVLERLLLVVDVEDGELLIIIEGVHG